MGAAPRMNVFRFPFIQYGQGILRWCYASRLLMVSCKLIIYYFIFGKHFYFQYLSNFYWIVNDSQPLMISPICMRSYINFI